MTVTRWKVMAGTLGVSLCGLAAVAESPKPPVPVPAPNVVELPAIPAAPTPPAVEPPPVLVPAPAVAAAPPEVAPAPKVLELKIPTEPTPAIIPAAAFEAAPVAPAVPTAPSVPAPITPEPSKPSDPAIVTIPGLGTGTVVNTYSSNPAVLEANPAPTPTVLTANVNSGAAPTPAVAPVAAVTTTPPAVTPAAVAPAEKKLRVLLNMGEDRPRFEVKDGEETLLKLVSDKVDVRCPEPGDAAAQTMKAVGGVTFVTPGGEGNCDELILTPGTGQVVVTGKVRFRYHWGKVETEVAGDRMTFRLGAGPANVVPASYTPGR